MKIKGRQPKVFIVILNWNGLTHTKECLKSLNKIMFKNFKIILVDNGSKNNEGDVLKKLFPKIILIKNKHNLGFVGGNNQAMRLALRKRGDYILLLNNDTVVKNDFLDHLVNYSQVHNFQGILTPKILYYKTNSVWAMGGKLSVITSIPRMIGQDKPSSNYRRIIEPDYATGCALFIPAKTLKKVGLLDKRFAPIYYEDTDLSFRTRRLGYKIKVIPESVIWHKVSQSSINKTAKKIGERQSFLLARNGLIFGQKNFEGFTKLLYISSQTSIKFILYLLLKCDSLKSRIAYCLGIRDGIRYILEND